MSDTSATATAGVRAFGKAAWRGEDPQRGSRWIHPLTEAQQAEIVDLGSRLASSGADVMRARKVAQLEPGAAPLVCDLMGKIRRELQHRDGFALVRGLPEHRLSENASRLAYAAMGSMLGLSMPQNRQGEWVHDARDTGADATDPDDRLSTMRAEQDLHAGAADVIHENLVILHKPTSYEDRPESDRRRHLRRLRIAAPDFADGIAAVRLSHENRS